MAAPSDSGLGEAGTLASSADSHFDISQGFKKPQGPPGICESSDLLKWKDNLYCCETPSPWKWTLTTTAIWSLCLGSWVPLPSHVHVTLRCRYTCPVIKASSPGRAAHTWDVPPTSPHPSAPRHPDWPVTPNSRFRCAAPSAWQAFFSLICPLGSLFKLQIPDFKSCPLWSSPPP